MRRGKKVAWLLLGSIALVILLTVTFIAFVPHQRESWEVAEAGSPDPSGNRNTWKLERRSGFRIFGRGLSKTFNAEIPPFESDSPLADSVFDLLRKEALATAPAEDINPLSEGLDPWRYEGGTYAYSSALSYQAVTCDPLLLSLLITHRYYTGGAHSNYNLTSRNFLWQDSSLVELQLSDLFIDTPAREWFEVLAKDVETDLRRQEASSVDYNLPFEEFSNFTITDKGLVIHFEPYEVSSFAHGFLSVVEPWESLRPFLKPGALLTRWVQQQGQQQQSGATHETESRQAH